MNLEEFVGDATPISAADFAEAAAVINVDPLRLMAVDDVESNGRGFHPLTRRPIILFEPHVFSKHTKGAFDATHPEISYPAWGTRDYPVSQETRYQQLVQAMALAEASALMATSWGRFQILGENYDRVGFPDVRGFVRAMARNEREQLLAFVRFVAASPALVAALKRSDWGGFARRYNGPAYAKHGYDQKLKAAFARRVAAQNAARKAKSAA